MDILYKKVEESYLFGDNDCYIDEGIYYDILKSILMTMCPLTLTERYMACTFGGNKGVLKKRCCTENGVI